MYAYFLFDNVHVVNKNSKTKVSRYRHYSLLVSTGPSRIHQMPPEYDADSDKDT